jgi:hypothetical protein
MNRQVFNTIAGIAKGGIPFKNDIVQWLFKTGENNVISSDGLYALDFSGKGNDAIFKNSFCAVANPGQTVDSMPLKTQINIDSSINWSFEVYFQTDSSSTTNFWGFIGGVIGGTPTIDHRVYFRQGTGINCYAGSTNLTFTDITDFKILRKYRINFHDGVADLYVNDTFVRSSAFSYTTWNITSLSCTRGLTNQNGIFFGLKITQNGLVTNYWPICSGNPHLFDVVGENHAILSYNFANMNWRGFQNLLHYNIKYGADIITNHSDHYYFVPRKMDGSKLADNPPNYPIGGGGVYINWKWNYLLNKALPFPACETMIQTLEGDITYSAFEQSDNIFGRLDNDQTFKDILVYDTAKFALDKIKINSYLKNKVLSDLIYDPDNCLNDIVTQIKTGTFKYMTVGDSLSPFTYKLNEQLRFFAQPKGLGFDRLSSGSYVLNNGYGDLGITITGTVTNNEDDNVSKERWGIHGFRASFATGATVTVDPYDHIYTNVRILYAQNTDKGSFNVVINGTTYSVNCNGAAGLGVFSQDITAYSGNMVINSIVGPVEIYGFELNNSTGTINHLLSNGGNTSYNFNSLLYPSYLSDYCNATILHAAIIMLGANDAVGNKPANEVKANISQIITDIRTASTVPIIVLTPTTRGLISGQPGEDLIYWAKCREYYTVFKELADELTDVCVIDLANIFPRYDAAIAAGYMDGVIHHTLSGQEYLSRRLYRTLLTQI